MTLIAHLSDLHFGTTDPKALAGISTALDSINPDLIVITGDFTQAGRRSEFVQAEAFLRTLKTPVLAVPGNHDAPVYNLVMRFARPWARFEKHIGTLTATWVETDDVIILGLNSARRAAPRLNWSFGKIRSRDILGVKKVAANISREKPVFVAAHHPFEVGLGKAGSEAVARADEALSAFVESGVSAVMTGHVHATSVKPLANVPEILSIQAGSAISTRQRNEDASFLVLNVSARPVLSVQATRFAIDEGSFRAADQLDFIAKQKRWSNVNH